MYVLTIQCNISQADLVSTSRYFCLKFESSFGRKDTVLTMMESDGLLDVLQILLIYPGEVSEPSRSNICLSLQQSVIFPRLMWCPKLIILLEN